MTSYNDLIPHCTHTHTHAREGWEPEGFISPTLQERQNKKITIVWADFVNGSQLFIIQMCALMDYSTFASRKSSLRAFNWCIYLHLTKNVTYALLLQLVCKCETTWNECLKKHITYNRLQIYKYRYISKNYNIMKKVDIFCPSFQKVKPIYYIDSLHIEWNISSLYFLKFLMIMAYR